jgi:hypothetical protein
VPVTPPGGWHVIKFFDDTEVRLTGLDPIMADFHFNGRQPNDGTAEEILKELEKKKNYIPSSPKIRNEYAYAVLKEYKKYIKSQEDKNR